VNAADAHGKFGKRTKVGNVDTNPLKDKFSWSGETENGGDPGLRITVRGDHSDGYVSGGEVVSLRDDIWYGSFRVGMKLTGVQGTVGSMFWVWILTFVIFVLNMLTTCSTGTTHRNLTWNYCPRTSTIRRALSTLLCTLPNRGSVAVTRPIPLVTGSSPYRSAPTSNFTNIASIGHRARSITTSMANGYGK